jgi:hypothetical protein
MQHLERTSRRNALPFLYLVLALLAFPALLAVACGGSASPGNQASQHSDASFLRYIQCLNQHGVPTTQSSDGGVQIGGSGVSDQQVQAAEKACEKYHPNGGQGSGHPSAQQMDQMARYIQCMNQHGIRVQQQGGTIQITNSQSIDPSKLHQADQACGGARQLKG